MVQTIQPGERKSQRRAGTHGVSRVDDADIDGVLYRLGRLQRVLVDVRAQVRELRAYASGARVHDAELTDPVTADLRRRLERVEEALGAMRDDFDVTRDAIDGLIDESEAPDAEVISLHKRSLPTGA